MNTGEVQPAASLKEEKAGGVTGPVLRSWDAADCRGLRVKAAEASSVRQAQSWDAGAGC